jgi:hypothetical protein
VTHNTNLRYEIKLTCDPHWLHQARSWIRLHSEGFGVAYPPRRVNSLYLDTLALTGLNENLVGVIERQKLRLRWYGDVLTEVKPNLELKQKYNMLGNKKVYPFPCSLDLTQPWQDVLSVIRANVPPDWQILLQIVNQPALLNRYQREYYVTPDGAVRATLDFDQIAYDQRLSPHLNLRYPLVMPDNVVVELKADQEHLKRLEEIAGGFPIPRNRNSKYVRGLLSALG